MQRNLGSLCTRSGHPRSGLIRSFLIMLLAGAVSAIAGAEALPFEREKPASGPYLPPPASFEVSIRRNVPIRLRDGVRLASDIYLPVTAAKQLPAVFMFTPYGKGRFPADSEYLAGQGFAVVVADVRGKHMSEGEFVVEHNHGEDGADVIAWIAQQAWSNGRVGMFGCSYLGQIQLNVARHRPPALKALITMSNGGGAGEVRPDGMNGARDGGALMLGTVLPWMREEMAKSDPRPRGWPDQKWGGEASEFYDLKVKLPEVAWDDVLMHLPLRDLMKATRSPPNDWERYLLPYSDPWWGTFGMAGPADSFDVPALHVGSWWDFSVSGSVYFWRLLAERATSSQARDNQFLMLAPTTHCAHAGVGERTLLGQLDAGDARRDYRAVYVAWLRHWLEGAADSDFSMPAVQYYTTGANEWRATGVWPPKGLEPVRLYLRNRGQVRDLPGDGELSLKTGRADERPNRYVYDPGKPTPTVGGVIMNPADSDEEDGAHDQSLREARSDVLSYTSPVLTQPLEITGPVSAMLSVSSSAPDTDFHVTLVEVHADGRALNVTDGIRRARHRLGFDKPESRMSSGEIYRIEVSMRQTSHVIAAGSRLRIDVASASFPAYDRNLNTGGDNMTETQWIVAENSVHHSTENPSYVVVLVPKEAKRSLFE